MEQVALAQPSVSKPCVTLRCMCRVAQGLKIFCFSKDRRGISVPVLPQALDQLFFVCVPQDPCGISRCLCRVLRVLRRNLCSEFHLCLGNSVGQLGVCTASCRIPGTNRVCVYCASGSWWDIPVFSRCRRPATPPARSVRYRVCLCVPSSFCVYKPSNLSLCLRTDSSLFFSFPTRLCWCCCSFPV